VKVIKITNIHAAEGPAVDVMPDSALQKSGKPFFIPEFAKNFEFKTAVAVHMERTLPVGLLDVITMKWACVWLLRLRIFVKRCRSRVLPGL
jgi:hypothetical protein